MEGLNQGPPLIGLCNSTDITVGSMAQAVPSHLGDPQLVRFPWRIIIFFFSHGNHDAVGFIPSFGMGVLFV